MNEYNIYYVFYNPYVNFLPKGISIKVYLYALEGNRNFEVAHLDLCCSFLYFTYRKVGKKIRLCVRLFGTDIYFQELPILDEKVSLIFLLRKVISRKLQTHDLVVVIFDKGKCVPSFFFSFYL